MASLPLAAESADHIGREAAVKGLSCSFCFAPSRLTLRPAVLTLVAAALLTACGGGGSDAGTPPFGNARNDFGNTGGSSSLPASSTLAQQCAANNALAPTASQTADLDRERRWVRSYVNEAYLWYREVPSVNTADANFNLPSVPDSLDNYFQALKTRAITSQQQAEGRVQLHIPDVGMGATVGFGHRRRLRRRVDPRLADAAPQCTRGLRGPQHAGRRAGA